MTTAIYTFHIYLCCLQGVKKRTQEAISSQIAQYLICYVGVEDFAFDNKPAFLPLSFASLRSAEVTADGSSLS